METRFYIRFVGVVSVAGSNDWWTVYLDGSEMGNCRDYESAMQTVAQWAEGRETKSMATFHR